MFGGLPLLHIYDASDFSIAATASVRRNFMAENIYPIAINAKHGGMIELMGELDKLRDDGKKFQRGLFETHGGPGLITFGGARITAKTLTNYFSRRGYERIFPYYGSKIYFNGCNVADSSQKDPQKGWEFLDAAGSVFLKLGGGFTMAQTGAGYPIIFTGHVIRFPGD
jgi:hypothetical protein